MSSAQYIEQRAALWVARREEPGWSDFDEAELQRWLAESDNHKAAFWRLECGWREADRIAALGAGAQPFRRSVEPRRWWAPAALAASLVLVFAAFLLGGTGLGVRDTEPQVQTAAFATAVGGHKFITLPDGTRVELNTDTAIRAAVGEARRAVWLDRGEAYFDVAKSPGRAFVIYAGARTITVLGTKFAVTREPKQIVVAVVEGRVSIGEPTAGQAGRATIITGGDVAIAKERTITVASNSAEWIEEQLAWRNGMLQFDDVPLVRAAEQFNRYNRRQLVVEDPEAAQTRIGGSFRARNVGAFASLLRQAYGLDVQDRPDRILVSSRRTSLRTVLRQVRADPHSPDPRDGRNAAPLECALGRTCSPDADDPPTRLASVAKPQDSATLRRQAKNWDVLHKLYPKRALEAREEGLVGFSVTIDSAGSPVECRVTHTSGHPLLDQETCQLIMRNGTFSRPTGSSLSQKRTYEGVVNWKLPTTPLAAVPPAPKRIDTAAAPEKLVCKRTPKTGTNAGFQRTCMTPSEWQRSSDEQKRVWEDMQGRASPGN